MKNFEGQPDTKTPEDMLARLKQVSPMAHEYVTKNDGLDVSIGGECCPNYIDANEGISTSFIWSDTPQGWSYWSMIAKFMGEK